MVYWISTLLVAGMLALSAFSYFFHGATIEGIRELGFPDFFRVQLGVLKSIAVLVLLIPFVPLQFKEWAYVGAGLFFVTAIVAHVAHQDSWVLTLVNIVFLGLLIVSNIHAHKMFG